MAKGKEKKKEPKAKKLTAQEKKAKKQAKL
jgi:hypothetical protein